MAESDQEKPVGGGSGGGGDIDEHREYMGLWGVAANQVDLISRPPIPPVPAAPYVINVFAPGAGTDGYVDVRGSKGVRITAGPPPLPPSHSSLTNGVELEVSEQQSIKFKRGQLPVDQKIDMSPGQLTIDAAADTLKINSITEIEISCAGGVCSIKLTPEMIVLKGPIIMIN
ncbi:MAG TPA: hypothetical protein VFQ00_12335 [Terriglobales bacterium]|nr:hypothetical protein [Terriglobales bacterium]